MDPLSIGTNIVNLARKIKVALETVDRNKDLCSNIREKVETIDAILSSAVNYTEMSLCNSALPNLRKALEKALNLIGDCQKKTKVGHLFTADQMSVKLGDANRTIMDSMGIFNLAMLCQLVPSLVNLTPSPDTDTKGERKKENGKGERKEAQDDTEKLREKKDLEERRHAERIKGKKHKETQKDRDTQRENEDVEEKEIGKGKNHKETQNDGEKQRENKDVKGKKNKETQEDGEKRREKKDVEEKRDTGRKMETGKGKNIKETQEDGKKRREKKDVKEIIDAGRKMETGKGKKNKETQEDGENRREKKDVEEKRYTGKKMEIGKGKKNKETREDGEKRREKKDVEEVIDAGIKMETRKGKKNKEAQEDGEKRRQKKDVKEKRDCPGLVRPKDSSVEDHDDSSRKEEYYSCSSRCSVSQLKAMIKDLSEKNIIEQYGDYIRYKANLSDGTRVRLHRIGRSGVDAVHDIRVRGTAKLKHINISELLGYFSHGGFFYVVEKSFGIVLSDCIYDNTSKGKELSWQQCSDIILYIADGVAYLHERGVIHMSLRSSKIAIGPEYVPKIYYSRILEIIESVQEEGVHTSFRMERGFEPPEYELHRRFSVKTDVYCYGVLLLKLITGQRWKQKADKFLTASVLQDALANNMKKCIQPRFIDAADGPQIEDIKRCIRIALLCVEGDPALRPTMHAVRGYLRDKNQDLPRISASLRTRAE